jgi:RNA polymerase sigma-70 factor (ECF subfamily)
MSFKAWVYAIANNLIKDRLRSKTRLEKTSLGEDNGDSIAVPNGHDDMLAFKEIFARLTEDQREAIVLSRFQGLSYDEIATVTGRSAGAVNQLIQRAMAHLIQR